MTPIYSDKLTLYNYFRSSTSYRASIALHWKGLEFEYRPVHLLNQGGEQFLPAYQQMNSAGEVPTLVHGDRNIGQSMAILQYLDEVFPQQPLFPKDSYEKAKVLQFCEGINCVHSLQNLKVLKFLEQEFGAVSEKKEMWIQEWMGRNFEASEKSIAASSGTYCFGGDITAAECFLVPQIVSAQRFQVSTERYPTLMRVYESAMKLEPFIKAHPSRQIDTPEDLKTKIT